MLLRNCDPAGCESGRLRRLCGRLARLAWTAGKPHAGGPPLVTSFDPEKGTNILWKNDEAGGISTPVIMGDKLYTLVRHKPGTTGGGREGALS
jgi:hypothetical protein